MSIYTLVLELDGGTYVAQADAPSEREAVLRWCDDFSKERTVGVRSSRLASAIKRGVESSGITPLSGLDGVWCFTTLFAGKLILGHVIATRQ